VRHAERIDDHRIPGGIVNVNNSGRSASAPAVPAAAAATLSSTSVTGMHMYPLYAGNASSSPSSRSSEHSTHPSPSAYDWRLDTEAGRSRPWDPPLSRGGIRQAEKLGRMLPRLTKDFKLPPLGAVYASPVVRCAETALAALGAHDAEVALMEKEGLDGEVGEEAKNTKGRKNGKATKTRVYHRPLTSGIATKNQRFWKPTTLGTVHFGTKVRPRSAQAVSVFELENGTDAVEITIGSPNSDDSDMAVVSVNSLADSPVHPNGTASENNSTSTATTAATTTEEGTTMSLVKVHVEQGIMECLHKQWYEQWCHCVPPDGTDPASSCTVHPMARRPATECFPGPSDLADMLSRVVRSYREREVCENERVESSGTTKLAPPLVADVDANRWVLPRTLLDRVDTTDHLVPFNAVPDGTKSYEKGRSALDRQHASVLAAADRHAGQTVLVITHYVPCAHLFGRLTGKDFKTEFEDGTGYTSFSVYVRLEEGGEGGSHGGADWKPLIVNDRRHLEEVPPEQSTGPTTLKKKYSLRSKLYGF